MSISGKVIFGTYVSQAQIDARNSIRLAFIDFEDDLGDLESYGFTQLPGEDVYYYGIGLAHVDACTPMNVNELYARCMYDLTSENKEKTIALVNKLPENIRNQLPPVGFYVIGEIMDVLRSNVRKQQLIQKQQPFLIESSQSAPTSRLLPLNK